MTLSPATLARIAAAHTVGGLSPDQPQLPYRSIGDLLSCQAARHGDAPWLDYFPDEGLPARYSYTEFHLSVCRAADDLRARGVSRGDCVATVSHNHADTVIQYFAAWMIGAVVVPINVGEDDKRILFIFENSGTTLAFVRDRYAGRIKKLLAMLPGIALVLVGDSWNTSADGPPEVGDRHALVTHDDDALIVYTSGTTGLPKGVVLTHHNLLVDAHEIASWHAMKSGDRMMCVLPIHHVNGIIVTLVTPLYYGGSVSLHQKFHSKKFFRSIAQESVEVVSVVPTILQFLLHERPDLSEIDLSRLRHIICGAGPLTVELVRNFESQFQIPIVHGYGLSETTCYSCFLPLDLSPDEHCRWLSEYGFPSIGVPLPCNEMAIHDEQGATLAEGARGEIVIRGRNVMRRYFGDPSANEQTFAHGWFRSGDEGFWKRGSMGRPFFFITGRIKELIIRGGTNISPFELDEVLMNMPGVKAGLAVGFENDWYGEEVGAYIERKEGSTVSERDVVEYCRQFFSYQKCPKVVLFGDNIPVTSTGKYQRNKLRPLFTKWKSTQFTERARG